MKESKYNIYEIQSKGVLCFNTCSDIYSFISHNDYKNLTSNLSALKATSPNLYNALIENHFLINDGIDEYKQLYGEYQKEVTNSDTYDLTLLPTLDCNLRCWYCYEKHILGSHLDERTSEQIFNHVQWIFEEYQNIDKLNIEMFGGEPLLYFETELYPLLKRIQVEVKKLGKQVSFFFVTNAVCITESVIPLFLDLNSNFQISIDGYKEKHDKVKFIAGNHKGTYDRVIQTIKSLTSQEGNTFVNLRINYDDDTLLHMEQLINDILEIDRRKIRIHLERVWQTSDFVDFENENLKHLINLLIINGFDVSYMNLSRRSCSCKASKRHQAVISYDGKVFKCSGRDFTNEHTEGVLQPDGSILWKEDELTRRMEICTFDNDLCRDCQLLPLCWGPCCQKQLEAKFGLSGYCQKNHMEMSMSDYICSRFNNDYIKQKCQ